MMNMIIMMMVSSKTSEIRDDHNNDEHVDNDYGFIQDFWNKGWRKM